MACLQTREQLVECWGEEEALGAEALAHMRECRECRREAELLRGTRQLLSQVEPMSAPGGFAGRVMAQVAQAEQSAGWSERVLEWLWPWRHSPAWGRALAVAAVVMVLISGLALLEGRSGTPPMQAPGPTMVAAGSGTGAVFSEEDLEALVLRHQALEQSRALSDDPGVHMISFSY